MKKIRFAQLAGQIGYNMDLYEQRIISLRAKFTEGNISAAAARRAFLELWGWFIHYVTRYNKLLSAWKNYDEKSYKDGRFSRVSVDYVTEIYYNWFMF